MDSLLATTTTTTTTTTTVSPLPLAPPALSLFDRTPLTLKEIYKEWDETYYDPKVGIRECDKRLIVLATRTPHVEMFNRYRNVVIPAHIRNHMIEMWIHETKPIVEMSLGQVVGTLFGLEWYLLSDFYSQSEPQCQTREWLLQTIVPIVDALRYRCYYFIKYTESSFVLDIEESHIGYTESVEEAEKKKRGETFHTESLLKDEDYYSDDEKKKMARKKMYEDTNKSIFQSWSLPGMEEDDEEEEEGGNPSSSLKKKKNNNNNHTTDSEKKKKKRYNSILDRYEEDRGGNHDDDDDVDDEDGVVCSTMRKSKEHLRRTTPAFVHDINCVFHELDTQIESILTTPVKEWRGILPESEIDLLAFRKYCRANLSSFAVTVLEKRKTWQHDQQVVHSQRMCYFRKTKKKESATVIIGHLSSALTTDRLPQDLDDMIAPRADAKEDCIWKRINTDFLFSRVNVMVPAHKYKGNCVEYLLYHQIMVMSRVGGRRWIWVDKVDESKKYGYFPSFTHAFVFMRFMQRKRNESPLIYYMIGKRVTPEKIDLSQFDFLLFK
jgi:hypothetical protein